MKTALPPLKFVRFIPAIAWFIMSFVLLCLPGSTLPRYSFLAVIHADKWIHICLFGTLCVLLSSPFQSSPLNESRKKNVFSFIAAAGIAYGMIMELVQEKWIPNRSFEWMDVLADSTGCLLGWLVSRKKFLSRS